MIAKHSIRHIVGNLGSTIYLLAIVNAKNQVENDNKIFDFTMAGYTNVRVSYPDEQTNIYNHPTILRNLQNLGIKLQKQTTNLLPCRI